MRQQFYTELCASIKAAAEGSQPNFKSSLLEDTPTDEINMTIKNYNLEKGISKRLFEPFRKDDAYEIKGPMGRGLGLTKDS